MIQSVTYRNGSTTRLTATRDYDYLNRLRKVSNVASGESLPLSY